jgi:hypothetical protein
MPSTERNCGGCRYWSQMIAQSIGGRDVEALCLNAAGPCSGKYMVATQTCKGGYCTSQTQGVYPKLREEFEPPTQDWRLDRDMTIAIAGFTAPHDFIVTVSDARISHGEAIPAADDGTMKNRKIASTWGMMFAANDASAFMPVVSSCFDALAFTRGQNDPAADEIQVKKAVQEAYEREFNERFFREHLARFGYSDISDFRKNGFNELGKDLYGQYAMQLAKFDLGLELLVYGFNPHGNRHVFEVANPGKIISHNLRGFAAIGSGAWMALAALNRKPITPGLPETIWRFLDAKFSAETAAGVGKKTHVIIMSSKGKFAPMRASDIEKLREKWEAETKRPESEEVMDFIVNTHAVKYLYDSNLS